MIDESSQAPLAYVNLYIQETQSGTTTDETGFFSLDKICMGHYHIIVSHIGCEDEKFHCDILSDTILNLTLSHTPISLGTVVVSSQKEDYNNQANLSVNRSVIEDNSHLNISGLLENETGVSLLKNGNGISKPVVHGLYGNRLIILNNGVAQSGQQWGNDHSPEIDPFALDKITIIKGANALEYGSGNLGAVILSEPKRIAKEPHLHGQVNYAYETNGRGQTLNTRLGKYSEALAWRLTGSLKRYGDRETPDYFLNNTGLEEANLSIQLEKTYNEKIFLDFYASTFNTRLGVLRGSHISNLTDLERALSQEEPFFTEPDFSDEIEAPMQEVSHHLAKAKAKYFISDNQIIEFVVSGQVNNRKEFDIRRSGRSEIPALSLFQSTVGADLSYGFTTENNWKLKFGNQTAFAKNTNNPETGIFPLIPNYTTLKSGLFGTATYSKDALTYNFGLRYDIEDQIVLGLTTSFPREVVRYDNLFHNFSALVALTAHLSDQQSLSWNVGYAMRNPAINELYSAGLHQGVSGIEEGDPNLNQEKALKNTLEYKWVPGSQFAFNVLGYYQYFEDYIYLNPQDEFRLTIRGAFPVFSYEQADADIIGLDVSTQYTISNSLLGLLKYSYLKGENRGQGEPLIFMPPNSLFASLTYRGHNTRMLTESLNMEDTEIEVTNRYVFRQNNLLDEQDFLAAPEAYNLFGLKVSTNFILPQYKIRGYLKVDNLFNTQYRDYLNRQRYFANDVGRSLVIGLNLKF